MKRVILTFLITVIFCGGCGKKNEHPPDEMHELPPRHEALFSKYTKIKKQQMEDIAEKRNIAIDPRYKKFFELAVDGKWKKAMKLYNNFRFHSTQWESKTPFDPNIGNELWHPVHEIGWGYGEFAAWDPDMLDLYAREILNSIPDGSIFFGATDPGRFVTSAFQISEGKPDIIILTQNSLFHTHYANYIKDIYGDRIWLPQAVGMMEAVKRYMEDVNSGRRPPSDYIKVTDGRVTIEGSLGYMKLNEALSQDIFEHNKDSYEFYIEEYYVLDWMRPYLEPHGLIMKINPDGSVLSDEVIEKDMIFWDGYVERLTKNEKFLNNRPARRAFSNLRCASAGLYADRGKLEEAEKAFKQAISIYPSSENANLRLVKAVYARQFRFEKAKAVLEEFKNQPADYKNEYRDEQAGDLLKLIDEYKKNKID